MRMCAFYRPSVFTIITYSGRFVNRRGPGSLHGFVENKADVWYDVLEILKARTGQKAY